MGQGCKFRVVNHLSVYSSSVSSASLSKAWESFPPMLTPLHRLRAVAARSVECGVVLTESTQERGLLISPRGGVGAKGGGDSISRLKVHELLLDPLLALWLGDGGNLYKC